MQESHPPSSRTPCRPLRLLEVGALPFPTSQGTQALLREQCEALARRGHDLHLLVYAHGAWPYEPPPGLTVHRLRDWPRERSVRSGPSWRKVALDGQLVLAVRRLAATLAPDLVHAHNYEALLACLVARPTAPIVYHAHTLFGRELPTFAQGPLGRALARAAGGLTDRLFPPLAAHTLTVSPRLADELLRLGHPAVRLSCALPGIEAPPSLGEPAAIRADLGLLEAEVVGYCGNLDAYQDLTTLLEAISLLAPRRPRLRLLVISSSESTPLRQAAARRGIAGRLVLAPHGHFAGAFAQVTAADLCVVPRSIPGGFPIKLLTYLSAARPVVSTRAGLAGLALGESVCVVADGDPRGLAETIAWLLDRPAEARRRGQLGLDVARRWFSWEASGARLEEQLRAVLGRTTD